MIKYLDEDIFQYIIFIWLNLMPLSSEPMFQSADHYQGAESMPFRPGPRFNIKMSSYQCRKSHSGDETILRPSYLHNGISYTGKTTSLYSIGAQCFLSPSGATCLLVYLESNLPLAACHTSDLYTARWAACRILYNKSLAITPVKTAMNVSSLNRSVLDTYYNVDLQHQIC